MLSTVLSFIVALVSTAALTPLVRRGALTLGAVDEPGARRVHSFRVPRMGGVAIVLGFFTPLLVLYALRTSMGQIFFSQPLVVAGLVLGSLLVAGLGMADDLTGVPARRKLAVQLIASTVVYLGGLRIGSIQLPGFHAVSLGWLSFPATILWITAITNALNLIDGLDGLAAGVAFFACATNFVVAAIGGNPQVALISATLGGSILGFLVYNFNPATIFMGDSGSMFLGFVLATTSLLGAASQKSPTVIAILVPLLALGLPIMDMLLAMVRRVLERRSIFSPDRGHLHHRLLDMGITHRRAVLILYGLSMVCTVVALAVHFGRSWQIGLAISTLVVAFVGVVRSVDYFNSVVTRRTKRVRDPLAETLRKHVPSMLSRVGSAPSVDDLPQLLVQFGDVTGMLAVVIGAPEGARLSDWRWDRDTMLPPRRLEAASVKFTIVDAQQHSLELHFLWDSADGLVDAQVEMLLQLVADAAESLLQRVARARVASRSGHLRPVS